MKKSLLIAVAALFVALGANAQVKRVPQATKVTAPMGTKAELLDMAFSNVDLSAKRHAVKFNAPRKAVSDIERTYIVDAQNFNGDFTASSSFEIVAESGTAKVYNLDTDVDDVDFEYNVKLIDFSWKGGVAYGYYHEDDGFIEIPVQTIATDSEAGRIVLSGVTKKDGAPSHIGFPMGFEIDSEGNLTFYEFEDELAESDYAGEVMSGWYSFLPDYSEGGAWNYGFDLEFYIPNAYVLVQECHIGDSGWTDWEYQTHWAAIEDYGTELMVHNFLDLAPISITVDGYDYKVPIPQQLDDYDVNRGKTGTTPDYYHLWSMDANGDPREEGTIDGKAYVDEDGYQVIGFYNREYREAWTDDSGNHEAGYYNVIGPTNYFMVSSTYEPGKGAYWEGEYRFLSIYVSGEIELNIDPTGINAVKATTDTKSTTLYDLQGRVVDGSYKGIVISNGKKMVVK